MKVKSYLVIFALFSLIIFLYVFDTNKVKVEEAQSLYKVYLKGAEIGLIENEEEIYELINNSQQEIKDEYNVDHVYPPAFFDILEVNTYDENISDINDIYSKIEESDDFTIKGYEITIQIPIEDRENITINVLDKQIFDDAILKFISAFIDMEDYNNFINDTQEEIVDEGTIIENMYFAENITIKESYISVNDKIYTNVDELTQMLIFGSDAVMDSYEVKAGDTIFSIADANKLNTQEFLIANPDYRDPDTLLVIGEEVNVTLLNPTINFVYEVNSIQEEEIDFVNTTIYDNTKSSGYSEITQMGVTGIERLSEQYRVTNGLPSQEVTITPLEVIREAVNQITVSGPVNYGGGTSFGTFIETGLTFVPAVTSGNRITSPFGVYRSGDRHTGTDYSGSGEGSAIYAIADGVVTQAANACSNCSRWSSGTHVVISHGNNFYSSYLHMVSGSLKVKVGDVVKAGERIGGMGDTGWSTGTHLHLGFSVGEPYVGAQVTYYDPHQLIYGR